MRIHSRVIPLWPVASVAFLLYFGRSVFWERKKVGRLALRWNCTRRSCAKCKFCWLLNHRQAPFPFLKGRGKKANPPASEVRRTKGFVLVTDGAADVI